MNNIKRTNEIVEALEQEYPAAKCSLDYEKPYELLIATRLSAQCTDARVNIVTKVLFEKYPTLQSLAGAQTDELEKIVKPCGFYRTKTQDIIRICQDLITRFGSKVPDNMEDLLSLSGVGRKTANLVLGDIYHKPSIVCDTHCIRITNLLGLTATKDPFKCETELKKLLPPEKSSDFCHRMVLHGRAVCKARAPRCEVCCLNNLCDYGIKALKNDRSATKKTKDATDN